jgi:hypothetical protein
VHKAHSAAAAARILSLLRMAGDCSDEAPSTAAFNLVAQANNLISESRIGDVDQHDKCWRWLVVLFLMMNGDGIGESATELTYRGHW